MAGMRPDWMDGFDDPAELGIDELGCVDIDADALARSAEDEADREIREIMGGYAPGGAAMREIEALKRSMRHLRVLRKASLTAHDLALTGIGRDPANPAMYRALQAAQKSLLDISDKWQKLEDRLVAIMKAGPGEAAPEGGAQQAGGADTSMGVKELLQKLNRTRNI